MCKARRTAHFRMDRINPTVNPPAGIPYAALMECSAPVVVQYSRLDTTQDANAMITTIAYAQ